MSIMKIRVSKRLVVALSNSGVLAFGTFLFLNGEPIDGLLRVLTVMIVVVNLSIFSIVKLRNEASAATKKVIFGAWLMVLQPIRVLNRDRPLSSLTPVDIVSLLFFSVCGCYYLVLGTREVRKAKTGTSSGDANQPNQALKIPTGEGR